MEKQSEKDLNTILESFNSNDIFYTPNSNPILKHIFNSASKSGNGRGIPDRIIFNSSKNVLIVIECKNVNCSIEDGLNDLKLYKNKMVGNPYETFFVSFLSKTNYVVYNSMFEPLSVLLKPENFNLNNPSDFVKENMEKGIHEIHNYIRDYTKISNEDKSFFIAIILISIQKESFRRLIESYKTKNYIFDILSENLQEFEIDISVFSFLRNDENNVHFYNLVKKITEIYDRNPSVDLLNMFYSEFVRYNNSDGKSLGIVLTPPHIVSIMTRLLDVSPTDVVLDLCSGTGSFLLEAMKYHPLKVVGCEFQTKLFNLLKCNFVLRGFSKSHYELIKGDCFANTFQATKSIINPPYGMRDKKELDFVLKQLESLADGGLAIAIIPSSKLNGKSSHKAQISKRGKIRFILNCNERLFYPNASVLTSIVLIEKSSGGHDFETDKIKVVDYSDDEVNNVRCNGKLCSENFEARLEKLFSDIQHSEGRRFRLDDDWAIIPPPETDDVDLTRFQFKMSETIYAKFLQTELNSKFTLNSYRQFRITDLFTIEKQPSVPYTSPERNVPLIVASAKNNGVKGFSRSNKNTFYGNKIVLVTGGDGGAGLAHYQEDDFNIESSTVVLVPTRIRLDFWTGHYCANELSKYKQKYSYAVQWNRLRISKDTIRLPWNPTLEEIDYASIRKWMKQSCQETMDALRKTISDFENKL